MPFFGNKRREPEPVAPVEEKRGGMFHRRDPSPTYAEPVPKKSGMFHRNHTPPPAPVQTSPSPTRHGIFHRRNSPTNSLSSAGSNPRNHGMTNGVLSKNRYDDESIIAARERVTLAERAEAEADRAMHQARGAVHSARLEVKRLEEEAVLQSRLAKYKADTSKAISKRARPLGRHGP